jgi:integrase
MAARMTKRADGRHQDSMRYTDPVTGEKKRQYFYGKTQAEVRAKMKEARARLDAGAPVKDASRTVGEWCAQWREVTLEASGRRETTKSTYRSLLRTHVESQPIGAIRLDRLRPSDVDAMTLQMREAKKSTSTINKAFLVLRAALDDAKRDGLLHHNPVRALKQPSVVKKEARHLAPAEVAALLKAAEHTRQFRLFALISATGLRKGEALALRWDDVVMTGDNPSLRVRGTLARIKRDGVGELVVSEPKTAKSRRTLPLHAAVVALFKAQHKAQAAERLKAGSEWSDLDFVFTAETGLPMDPSNVLRAFKTAAKAAGLSNVDVHTLRHSAATQLMEITHMRGVADLLGHADIRTTAEIYGHTSSDAARTAMDGLAVAFDI